ncbi:Peptidase S10, serine carboxypeptidase [Cynara cardunculus var. scolymus]|uniref:Peptidase S10, serine carboxypeptidase n=1 Tax=Cynara cardunculus var. scolymus TaxID=59895 RepID=A0A103RXA7_CYNCS|nr:Peptidase S10, serine carboxypeptidase [Cynara cardunculus var. scolymus]
MTISLLIIFLQFITSSCSNSTVKNLPGFNGDLPFTLQTGYVYMFVFRSFFLFLLPEASFGFILCLFFMSKDTSEWEKKMQCKFSTTLWSLKETRQKTSFSVFRWWPWRFWTLFVPLSKRSIKFQFESSKRVANMIFVDLPIGVGFSYAKTWEASRSSDSLLAVQGYEFLRKWLVENPRFVSNSLYGSGISYMGIVVLNMALEVYKGNELGNQPQVNIKFIDFNSRFEYAHRLALISDDMYESTKASCDGDYVYNVLDNSLCADNLKRVDECTSRIKFEFILEPLCNVTDSRVPTCKDFTDTFIQTWVNYKDVQKALNIREGTTEKWEYVNTSIAYDLKKNNTVYYSYDVWSTIESHKQLLTKNCQALIICAWEPWFVGTQVAGYQMTYARRGSSIQFATVKGAGHALTLYKPEEALALMDRWLASHAYLSFSS